MNGKLEQIIFQKVGFVTLKNKLPVKPEPFGIVSCYHIAKNDINAEYMAVERAIKHEKLDGYVNAYNICSKFIDQHNTYSSLWVAFQFYKIIGDTKKSKKIKFIKFKNRGYIEIESGNPIKVEPVQNVSLKIAPFVELGWERDEDFINGCAKDMGLKGVTNACCCIPLHPLKKFHTLKTTDDIKNASKFVAIQLYKI